MDLNAVIRLLMRERWFCLLCVQLVPGVMSVYTPMFAGVTDSQVTSYQHFERTEPPFVCQENRPSAYTPTFIANPYGNTSSGPTKPFWLRICLPQGLQAGHVVPPGLPGLNPGRLVGGDVVHALLDPTIATLGNKVSPVNFARLPFGTIMAMAALLTL